MGQRDAVAPVGNYSVCWRSAGPFAVAADTGRLSDPARAEYVFACMASNGQTQQTLRQCSCSIDVIASVLPYRQI